MKMIKQIFALKSHLEQAFIDNKRVPVTCFFVPQHTQVAPNLVALGKQSKPTSKKSFSGLLKKYSLDFTPQSFRGFPSQGSKTEKEIKLPLVLDLSSLISKNQKVQVSALSKGKGFTGVIKRWGFSAQPRTHGQSDRRRAPGSIGRGTTPGRVVPGKKMAGRSGNVRKTIKNLSIIDFHPENSILKISGLTPGPKNTLTKITFQQ